MYINRQPPSKIVIFNNYFVREDTVTVSSKRTFLERIKNKLLNVIRKCFHQLP